MRTMTFRIPDRQANILENRAASSSLNLSELLRIAIEQVFGEDDLYDKERHTKIAIPITEETFAALMNLARRGNKPIVDVASHLFEDAVAESSAKGSWKKGK